ncbi:MAG: arginase [Sphaerospermopsis sp. SIO1G2]|nr:arginase [Sphaerospermopsis sp. SIO1G2]
MKNIHLLGIPMDLGQNRRGVDMGPSALRYAGLQPELERLGHDVHDAGNLTVPGPEQREAAVGDNRLQAVTRICQAVFDWGQNCPDDVFTLHLGGDHSISIGSVKAAAARHNNLGVIWVDAHADFNTPETSPSGNIHGMPVAVLTGAGADSLVNIGAGRTIPAQNIVQIGIRDVDDLEKANLNQSGVHVFTMPMIDSRGMAAVARQALAKLNHCHRIHVSLDLDSLAPTEAPGVGTPVRGGLTYREAHLLMEMLGDSGRVCSADIVEVNPILDRGNMTAELAVELIASLLGKKIL